VLCVAGASHARRIGFSRDVPVLGNGANKPVRRVLTRLDSAGHEQLVWIGRTAYCRAVIIRTVFLFVALFARRDDLAMWVTVADRASVWSGVGVS